MQCLRTHRPECANYENGALLKTYRSGNGDDDDDDDDDDVSNFDKSFSSDVLYLQIWNSSTEC